MRDSRHIFRRALLTAFVGALALASSAAAQEASTSYRNTGRDPFSPYKPAVRRKVEAKKAAPVEPPAIQKRVDNYKAQKAVAMSAQRPAPKPTTAFLLSELQVSGIFRTPRGYAAMVEVKPIKMSYVVYPGEPFYDGMLVAIEESRLVFRRQTRWTDGRLEVAVETKPLQQPNVEDSLSTPKSAEGQPSAAASAPAPAAGVRNDAATLLELLKALAAGQAAPAAPAAEGKP